LALARTTTACCL